MERKVWCQIAFAACKIKIKVMRQRGVLRKFLVTLRNLKRKRYRQIGTVRI